MNNPSLNLFQTSFFSKKKTIQNRFFNPLAILILSFLVGTLFSCGQPENTVTTEVTTPKKEMKFTSRTIADSVKYVWAHCPADVTGDGLLDLVFINNNGSGGYLGYFSGQKTDGIWKKTIVAETAPGGGKFAMGDMEVADMDGDGDIDIVAAEHTGEWDKSDSTAALYWLENPSWQPRLIGEIPAAIKDISLTDFNKDDKMDVAVLTFEGNTLSIFQQESVEKWPRVQFLKEFGNLHEGMAVGDVDGDGWTDIVANAHFFKNPGGKLEKAWPTQNVNNRWNNQTGDWSRNGTKAFLRDINEDGRAEIFVSHSERGGYPLVWYQQNSDGEWQEHLISDSIAACHTLQVFDFDNDGDYDVLAGVNRSRAVNINVNTFPVTIFLSENNYENWRPVEIAESIYNGQAGDFDGDGDIDILRYKTHEATDFQLLENTLNR